VPSAIASTICDAVGVRLMIANSSATVWKAAMQKSNCFVARQSLVECVPSFAFNATHPMPPIATAKPSATRRDRHGCARHQIVEILSHSTTSLVRCMRPCDHGTVVRSSAEGAANTEGAVGRAAASTSASAAKALPATPELWLAGFVCCWLATGAIPRLAGQNTDDLAHALSMFKDGTRASGDRLKLPARICRRFRADRICQQRPQSVFRKRSRCESRLEQVRQRHCQLAESETVRRQG
jgi:cytochrome c553